MDVTTTIGQLAVEHPQIIGALERWKIDYCCHGGRTVRDACAEAGVAIEDLTALLGTPKPAGSRDWNRSPLPVLLDFILETHHVYTRRALDTIGQLSAKVANRHGTGHPEVIAMRGLVMQLIEELEPHMAKEEMILFPYVRALEEAGLTGGPLPYACFDSIGSPISVMLREHDVAGELLVILRATSNDYALPGDACLSFRAFYEQLQQLEEDLHRHIHLENNVLFPRAITLESAVRESMYANI
jgi:regulator of cell morphogenesis and NO signaling